MKTIHQINFWTMAINIVLFLIPFLGMMFMMVLGFVQLILALAVVFCHYRDLDRSNRMLIKMYWLFAIIDLAAVAASFAFDNFTNDLFSVPFLFFFPAAIAIYFVYTTYTITKNLSHEHPAPQH